MNDVSVLLIVIGNGDNFAAEIIWNFVAFLLIFQRFLNSLMLFMAS